MENSQSLSLRKSIAKEELLNWQGQAFVPYYRLYDLVKPQVVKPIFQERGIEKYQEDEAVEAVWKGGIRVFAILNGIGQETTILLFRSKTDIFLNKPLDSGLPYDQHFLESILPKHHYEFYQLQWKFNSPVFRRNVQDRLLPSRTILPFLKVADVTSRGAFAEVCRITLPGSHQAIEAATSRDIVLVQKRLNLSNNVEKNFKHEQHILSMLRILKHPNIVEFHTAFTFESRPTLLFSEAECDLREWLRGDRSAPFSGIETIEALYGLSSALSQMHRYLIEGQQPSMFGCHFDLHPGNVLIRGRSFILSDFGLSRLKYEAQGSQSYFQGGVRDYCAPECQQWEDTFDRNKSGRPSDIWSFGCIIAELATFIKYGPEGLRRFDELRRVQGAVPALRTFHDRGRPHQGVETLIEELKSDVLQHTDVAGLANLVCRMLVIDPKARWDAARVSAELYLLSFNFRYFETAARLKRLISKADYGWRVEYDRLKIWAAEMGADKPLPNERAIGWLLEPSSSVQRENIRRLLLQINDDCEAQLHYLTGNLSESCDVLPLHVLRVSIDGLWHTQTPKTIKKMSTALENVILAAVDDAEISRVAKYLPKGSRPQLLLAIKQALTATNTNMNIKENVQVERTMIRGHRDWQGKTVGENRVTDEQMEFVLTEFLEYDDFWIGRSEELVNRINALVLLLGTMHLEKTLPLLRCKTFCHCPDRQAYGMMYEIPQGLMLGNHASLPLNLAEIIGQTSSYSRRPALGRVFKLAHTLAASLLSFHKAGWLHKGICAYNVIFFPQTPNDSGALLSTVRMIGFNYSRESDRGIVTVGPRKDKYIQNYQHPEYCRAGGKVRFREDFDYYGLGLVLLELGRWKVLRDLIKAKEKETLSPEDLTVWLLEEEVSQLKASRGTYYHDAVVACLLGFNRNEAGPHMEKLWYEFERAVVQRLMKCLAIHPGNG